MKTTLSPKGQLTLPAELRKRDRLSPGQQFTIVRLAGGVYLLRKADVGRSTGLLKWLASCPEKDFFRPIPSESTAQSRTTRS